MFNFFVFDTSVLISAAIRKDSIARKAFDHALTKGTIVRSAETFAEFASRIVRPKFDKYLMPQEKLFTVAHFKSGSIQVDVPFSVKACRDPNDDMFLSLSVAVDAACIVTRDLDLLELHPFRGIPIITPSDFLKKF